MEVTQFTYTIDGESFVLKPLVMGQLNQLINLIKDVEFKEDVTIPTIITTLGDKLPEAIAIILHEPEVELQKKNIKELAERLAFAPEMTPELCLQIVEDFFVCTPVSSLLKKVNETVEKVSLKINEGIG